MANIVVSTWMLDQPAFACPCILISQQIAELQSQVTSARQEARDKDSQMRTLEQQLRAKDQELRAKEQVRTLLWCLHVHGCVYVRA